MSSNKEVVTCIRCGQPDTVPANSLTASGKQNYKCGSCRVEEQQPMESRIAEQAKKGKKYLTEDL
jgi:transposase-like protein